MKKRLYHASRRFLGRLTVSPFRLLAYVLHATGLERFYKPRFTRHSALLDLSDDVVAKLPKHCFSITGVQMDPMNLIFVGTELELKLAFRAAGWHRANPASPFHLLYGLLTALLRRPYRTGPFTPLYVNIALQDLAYQKTTLDGNFRQRHHLRIWRTGIILPSKKRVWVGAASFDTSLKIQLTPPFIHHAIDPNLDKEREHVVRSLQGQGVIRLKSVGLNPPVLASRPRSNAYGARYYSDGRAVVLEV
jgi:hypothetical protein